MRSWSQSLAMELEPKGIQVQHVNAYFVTTAMSKIRRPSFTTPTPKAFVASVLKAVGNGCINNVPHFSHALAGWGLGWISDELAIRFSRDMHLDIRKRALRKREREAGKKAQ